MLSPFLAALAVLSPPDGEPQSVLEAGFAGALRGCQEWVLNPESWTNGVAPFTAAVGLGDAMGRVAQVDEVSLPPPPLRRGNHYWRINSTETAGYVLVVSDELPMCHITGGGDEDLQPVVLAVLASPEFRADWEPMERSETGDRVSTAFRNRTAHALSAVVSHASTPGARRDRVQVLVTATYAWRSSRRLPTSHRRPRPSGSAAVNPA